MLFFGNFTNLNAYTTENYSIDIPQNFKRTEDKISGIIYKKDNEKDFSIGSIPKRETAEEFLGRMTEGVKIEVVEINGYKAFFSQVVDNEGVYNGGYEIFTDNYFTYIVVHSTTDIKNDIEIQKIVSSIKINDTTQGIKTELEKYKVGKTIIKKMKLWPFFLVMVILITLIILIIIRRKNHNKNGNENIFVTTNK